nr:hypothetical protein [Tanacetum cinerariifolium]
MGDEHLDTIPAIESDEFIKSSVENLIPIPSEYEGIPDHMCDVPSHDNSPPLYVSKDQFEDFSESNDEFSSTDDDSFSIDNIDYVEASSPDSELVSSEVMEIVIPEVGGIEASNDNPIPFYDPIIFGTPSNLTPSGESDFFLEGDMLLLEAFLNDDHSSNFKTKSSSTSLNSLFEETNNFDNSLHKFTTFSKEDIIPMKLDQHPDNVEFDLMESLRTHDSSLLISSKIDSLLDEFAGELTLLKSIPLGIDETDYDFKEDIRLIKKLLYDNSSPLCYDDDDDEERSNSLQDNIISGLPPCSAITPNEPIDSLSMGDEHLNTILAKESDEFISPVLRTLSQTQVSSRMNLSVICLLLKLFTTFSNVLFDADYDFYSVDNQSLSDEEVPEKIFSNPLFDEEIIPMKIDPHHFNAESDLIESMPNHDSSIIISLKIDSLFDEFAGELTLLKSILLEIDETDSYPEKETHFTKRLLYDNSSPRPPKEFVYDNSDTDIESFSPSPIPIKDSNPLMEEIDLSFNPDDPMPPGIEEDDDESEKDILIHEEFLDNYSLSLPVNESYHFDIPSSSRPPPKPPDGNTGILNIKMMGDISDQKVPMPKLMITLVSNQEKSLDLLPHQGL